MIGILCTVLELPDPTPRGARSSSHFQHCNAPRYNEIMQSIFQRDRSAVAGIRVQLYIFWQISIIPRRSESANIAHRTNPLHWSRSLDQHIPLLVVSVFTFAEFLSAMPWAWVADRIRRRYTLLIGIVGSIVSAAVFGLSRNIALAAVTRAVGGLMNPNVGVVQTCTGELATRKDQQGGAISCYGFRCELRSCSKSFSNCALSSGPWVGICCVCV
jgi:MFS family permease